MCVCRCVGVCRYVCVCGRGGGGVGAEKYESILCFESGLIHTLLNLAQQFTRFRKHHYADGLNELVSPDLQYK